jgi:hypothetical protein
VPWLVHECAAARAEPLGTLVSFLGLDSSIEERICARCLVTWFVHKLLLITNLWLPHRFNMLFARSGGKSLAAKHVYLLLLTSYCICFLATGWSPT